MQDSLNPLRSTPTAVLLGSLIVAISVLMHGGIIKLGKPTPAPAVPTAAQPAAQPRAVKGETDIIKNLKSQASKVGLDQNKFNACLDSGSKAPLVQSDFDDGTKAGVNGTPAFFINGRLISGAVPYSEFQKVIDEELAGAAPASTQRVSIGAGNLPPLGNASAKVTLIEFSDYQCPFCARHFTQTEGQIIKAYIDTGKVKFYYRDFPLPQIHPGAQKSAEAARCAGDQNKYWEYHDLVFQNQQDIF